MQNQSLCWLYCVYLHQRTYTAALFNRSILMSRLVILVDVQNIYYTTRQAYAASFDYNRLWREVSAGHEVVKAIAYATERGDEKQRQFQNILRAIGFEVKLKPYVQRADGSSKGDWDVGITLDAMQYAAQTDRLVLVSGDGDFDLLVQRVRDLYNITVDVFGVPELTAFSLIRAASSFTAIEGDWLLKKR